MKSAYKPIADVVYSSTSLDPKSLQIIVPGLNIMSEAQCDFADGICGSQPPYRIPLINWECNHKYSRREQSLERG